MKVHIPEDLVLPEIPIEGSKKGKGPIKKDVLPSLSSRLPPIPKKMPPIPIVIPPMEDKDK